MRDKLTPVLVDLVLGFCHDCGNSVRASTGYLYLINELPDSDIPTLQTWRERAYITSLTSEQMINDLQGLVEWYHRVSESTNSLVNQDNIQEALQNIVPAMLIGHNATLHTHVKLARPDFILPTALLQAFVVPLVMNSVQAHQTVKEQAHLEITVCITYIEGPPRLHIAVEDNGPGWQGKLAQLQMSISHTVRFHRSEEISKNDIVPIKGQSLRHLFSIAKHLDGELLLLENSPQGAKIDISIPWETVSEPVN